MSLRERFPINSTVLGIVHGITPFGAFITIEDNFRGLLHISKMCYTKKIKHPNLVVKKGDALECTVISIDEEKGRVGLSATFTKEYPQ